MCVCVCVCVCVYVKILSCAHIYATYFNMGAYINIQCIYKRTNIYTDLYIHTHTLIYIYICVCVCVCVCVRFGTWLKNLCVCI